MIGLQSRRQKLGIIFTLTHEKMLLLYEYDNAEYTTLEIENDVFYNDCWHNHRRYVTGGFN